MPEYTDIAVEFGPHSQNRMKGDYQLHKTIVPGVKVNEFWQGTLSSWDSRPRVLSGRTRQRSPSSYRKPNGLVSVEAFRKRLNGLKKNTIATNTDKIITIFAFNEWSEGGVLEESREFGTQFVDLLEQL